MFLNVKKFQKLFFLFFDATRLNSQETAYSTEAPRIFQMDYYFCKNGAFLKSHFHIVRVNHYPFFNMI